MTFPVCAASADAEATNGAGGVSPTGTGTGTGPGTTEAGSAPAKPLLHLAPVVASRHTSLAYRGPVYQKLATGEVVPYVAAGPTTTTAAPAASTGGASPTATTAAGT